MPSPAQLKLINELLNLAEVKVIDYQTQEKVGMIIKVQAKNQKAICPRCGQKSEKLHQNHWYLVRDLPISNQPVYLRVNRRQFKCQECQKPFSDDLPFVGKRKSYTKRLAEQIIEQVLTSNINIRSVAEKNDLSEDIVERMIRDVRIERLEKETENPNKL